MDEWISVDDALPDIAGKFLVRYHAHFPNEEITEFDLCTAFFDGEEFQVKDRYFYKVRPITVTHYMPLPNPPIDG